MLYILISGNSIFQVLKYINIINFMLVTPIYRYYFNLNIFHYPVNIITGFIVIAGLAILSMAILNISYFSKHDCINVNQIVLPGFISHKKKAHTGVTYHELYKILFDNKVILVIFLFIGFQIYISLQPKTPLTYIDFYYRKYMNALEGQLTEEKLHYIADEQKAFDKAMEKINLLHEQFQNGEISEIQLSYYMQAIQDEFKYIDGFNKMIERLNYIKSYESKDGKSLWFVYERGWYYLSAADGNGYTRDISNALKMVVTMIVSLSFVFSIEFSTGMIHIISVYKRGRKDTFHAKVNICIGITTVIFIITYLPEVISAAQQFGLHSMAAPLASLPELKDSIVSGTILRYMITLFLMRYLTAILIMMLILWISTRSGNMMICTVISTLLFAVPLMMHLLGIRLFDKFSLNAFLSGNMLLNPSTDAAALRILLLLAGFLVPIILGILTYLSNRTSFTKE